MLDTFRGVILDILLEAGKEGVTLETVSDKLRQYLSTPSKESKLLAQRRIDVLGGRGWCMVSNGVIKATKNATSPLRDDLKTLVDGALNRLEVRGGAIPTSQYRPVTVQSIEWILMARGWDLGAHFAGGLPGGMPKILSTVSKAVDKHGKHLSPQQRQRLSLAIHNLLQYPDETESTVLAQLGRIAFALQLVFTNPCATIAHQAVLPDRVYLDASVLMPAMIEGHPYRPAYVAALRRLHEAARAANIETRVAVAEEFLNEIISHRDIARREVEAMSLGNREEITRHILAYGAENINVFVTGYANCLETLSEDLSFDRYLARYAPYGSEQALSQYLRQHEGLKTITMYFTSDDQMELYHEIKHALINAYESDPQSRFDPKQEVLIEHEARQLTLLSLDLKKGLRSVFVTADKRLRRLAIGSVLTQPGSAIISHRGLVQLIDMLVGLEADPAALTRLYWGGGITDETVLIRDYFVNLALRHRDEAMTMAMSEVLDATVRETTDAAEREHISLFPGGTVASKSRRADFFARFEDRFYANMAEANRRRFPEEYNLAEVLRRENLERRIQLTREQITSCETRLSELDDPREKASYEEQLATMTMSLQHYRNELENMTSSQDVS